MKFALILSLFFLLATSPYVTDSTKMVTAPTKTLLEKQLKSLEAQEGVRAVVVIVPSLEGQAIQEVSQSYFNRLQVGRMNRDSGILLIIAPKEHESFIDLGYGLEDYINQQKAEAICHDVINPILRKGSVDQAVKEGVQAIFQAMGKSFGEEGAEGTRSIYTTTHLVMFLLSMPLLYLIARTAPSRFFFLSPLIGFVTGITQSIVLAIVLAFLGAVMVLICYMLKKYARRR